MYQQFMGPSSSTDPANTYRLTVAVEGWTWDGGRSKSLGGERSLLEVLGGLRLRQQIANFLPLASLIS
jgi:hypothetical protein